MAHEDPLSFRPGRRLLPYALAGAVLLLLAEAVIIYSSYERSVERTFAHFDERQLLLVEEVRSRIARRLEESRRTLENDALLNLIGIDDRGLGAAPGPPNLSRVIRALGIETVGGRGASLLLVGPKGQVAARYPPGAHAPPPGLLEMLVMHAEENVGLAYCEGAPEKDGSIILARPLRQDGLPTGSVLAVRIDLRRLYEEELASLGIGQSGYSWVIDETGTIILAPAPSQPGSRPFSKLVAASPLGRVLARMRRGESGTGRYAYPEKEDAEEVRRVAFLPYSFMGKRFAIAESASEGEVLAEIRRLAIENLVFGGFFLLVVSGALAFLGYSERRRRKRSEELSRRLTISERRYRLALEQSPAAILEVELAGGAILSANGQAGRLLGRDARELLGLLVEDLAAPGDEESMREFVARLRRTGTAETAEIDLAGTEGSRLPVALHGGILLGSDPPTGQLVATDLRERKRLEEKLVGQDRLATLGLLTAGIAHEMKNPLGCVIVNTEHFVRRLDDTGGEAWQREILDDLLEAGERLHEIVKGLNKFGRTPESRRFQVAAAVGQASRIASHKIRYRATLTIGSFPGEVIGSETELSQVILNLLVNAVQAFPESRPRAGNRIEVDGRLLDSRILIEVRDNGSGIPAAVLPHIFDRFFTTKTAEEGTGLGLFISKAVIERMGGTIAVESQQGAGTTFRICLPQAAKQQPTTSNKKVPGTELKVI